MPNSIVAPMSEPEAGGALVDVNATPIAWREAGGGDIVVFLHGIGASRTVWDRQLVDLADDWRCVAWDMPGYGGSEPVDSLTFPIIADAVVGLLDTLGAERAHLIGLSFGGQHALHTAIRHPERVRSLVLADTSPAFGIDGTTREEWVTARLGAIDGATSFAGIASRVIGAVSAPGFAGPAFDDAVAAMERVAVDAFRASVRCLPDHDVRHRLGDVATPTLVIVGELDRETPPSYAEALAYGIPNAEMAVIADVGHLTPMEAPAEFNRLVREFLRRVEHEEST